MKSSISKKRAQKKFYRADFESLKGHENIVGVMYHIEGIGDCGIICRWHINKDKALDITPIGAVINEDELEGEVKLSMVEVNGAECLAVQDVKNGEVIKTIGLHMSNDLMDKGVVDGEKLGKLVNEKLGL